MKFVGVLVEEMRRVVRFFLAVMSGPVGWVIWADGWRPPNEREWAFQSWFVCMEYGNGRHIPYPILSGDSGNFMQMLAIMLAKFLSGNAVYHEIPEHIEELSDVCVVFTHDLFDDCGEDGPGCSLSAKGVRDKVVSMPCSRDV